MKKLKLLFLALIILFSCDTGDKSPDTNFKIIHVSAESSRASRETLTGSEYALFGDWIDLKD